MADKFTADISLRPSLEGPANGLAGWKIPVWLDGSLMVLSDAVVALLAFVLGSNYKSLGPLAGAAPSLESQQTGNVGVGDLLSRKIISPLVPPMGFLQLGTR